MSKTTESKPRENAREPCCLSDFEKLARQSLKEEVFNYVSIGADGMTTLKNNIQAFQRIQLRPRLLRGISRVSLSTTILGHQVSMPICVSPTALQKLTHPDGEVATSKGCAKAKTIMVRSFFATTPVEDVVSASSDTLCFQHLFLLKDKDHFKKEVFRAEKAGVKGFILTVDEPVRGKKRFIGGTDGMNKYLKSADHELEFSLDYDFFTHGLLPVTDLEADWSTISWLKSLTKLPVITKGILTAEDARLAVQHGADAIIVSNHGGRQLDGVPATIDALPEVVKAVNGQVEVYMDGGVRLGTDVLKALALGARAVFIGRPVLYGLAYQGEEGVYKVLEILRDELTRAMLLSGCSSVNDIPSSIVSRQCQCHL